MGKRARDTYVGAIAKRTRSRLSTKTGKSRTNYVKRTWPYQRENRLQMWDPFPAKARALLRYSTVVTLNPSIGLADNYLFRANSIFDPDFTGAGHKPYGYSTYASIYNEYNVAYAKITMTPSQNINGIFGITLTDDNSVQGNYDTIREVKTTRFATSNANAEPQSVTNTFNCNSNFDIAFQKATSSSFGQSPSEAMYFHCWFEGNDSSADVGAATFVITISYMVDMWELKDLGQST